MQHEFGERSSTGLGGVPPEFQDRTIATEFDLISGIEALYPYYGFSGSETLEYEDQRNVFGHTQYHFRQYIDGIETSQPVTIYVDNQSKRVMRIPGSPQIDRLVDRTPRLTAQQAIDIAVRYVQQSEDSRADLYNLNGAHDAEFVYQNSGPDGTLVPYWRVQLAISERFPGAAGESLLVGPNGEVDTGRITVR